jgi:CRP-like cAMP-binding protein
LEFLGRGEIIGEIEAILDSYSLAEVQTMSTVALFKIDKPYFQQLMKQDLEFNALVVASLANRLRNTALKAAFQQTNTTEVALQRLLLLLKQEQIRLPKNDLANYLGITVRTLNRSLKRLNESI